MAARAEVRLDHGVADAGAASGALHDPSPVDGARVDRLGQLRVVARPVAVSPDVHVWHRRRSRSSSAVAITGSPSTRPHSSKPLFEVSTGEARS